MRQIEDPASEALTVLQALESLARLAWNDDDVREQVAQMDGMHHATCMIRQHAVKAESINIHSHKAEFVPAFWHSSAANSVSVSIHSHKAGSEPAFWQHGAANVTYVRVWAGTHL